MGEAKRKNKQAKQVEEGLRGRVRAGEFGKPGALDDVCVVLDKSQRAADTLKALRERSAACDGCSVPLTCVNGLPQSQYDQRVVTWSPWRSCQSPRPRKLFCTSLLSNE